MIWKQIKGWTILIFCPWYCIIKLSAIQKLMGGAITESHNHTVAMAQNMDAMRREFNNLLNAHNSLVAYCDKLGAKVNEQDDPDVRPGDEWMNN